MLHVVHVWKRSGNRHGTIVYYQDISSSIIYDQDHVLVLSRCRNYRWAIASHSSTTLILLQMHSGSHNVVKTVMVIFFISPVYLTRLVYINGYQPGMII